MCAVQEMNTDQIGLDEFTRQIECIFGRTLTPPARQAATDFWNHWREFAALISRRRLSARVDPFFLARNFPQYRRYHTWKGAGIVLLGLGLITVWFAWPIGVALLVGALAARSYGNHVRFNDAKAFAEEVMKEATLSASDAGFARLCANYVAGVIELATPECSAHWPQHPSNVLTGHCTQIDTGNTLGANGSTS